MMAIDAGSKGSVSPFGRPWAMSLIEPPPTQTPFKSIMPSRNRGAGPVCAGRRVAAS